jgi:hypothetical protein
MVGIPEQDIADSNAYFTINDEFIDAVSDKDVREAMIERAFSTLH